MFVTVTQARIGDVYSGKGDQKSKLNSGVDSASPSGAGDDGELGKSTTDDVYNYISLTFSGLLLYDISNV